MKTRPGRLRIEARVEPEIAESISQYELKHSGLNVDKLIQDARSAGFEDKFKPRKKKSEKILIDTDISPESHEFLLELKKSHPGMTKAKVLTQMVEFLKG